jgi:hypothetical protein
MKYTKRLVLNRFNPSDNTFAVQSGTILTNVTGAMELPSGSTSQRPPQLQTANGDIRYNTTLQDSELYNISGAGTGWEKIKTNRQSPITPQNLGYGNYSNTLFGPLAYNVSTQTPQNVFVFVDNVYQIPYVNYTLVSGTGTNVVATLTQNPGPRSNTLQISTTTNIFVGMTVTAPTGIANGTTVTSVSTSSLTVTIFPLTNNSISISTPITFSESSGVYINFTSAVPAKPVFALLGFDGYAPPNN